MINALDVLRAATLSQAVETIVVRSTHALLSSWRADAPGSSDDEILREKLIERGWEGTPEPRTLQKLASLISTVAMNDALNKELHRKVSE